MTDANKTSILFDQVAERLSFSSPTLSKIAKCSSKNELACTIVRNIGRGDTLHFLLVFQLLFMRSRGLDAGSSADWRKFVSAVFDDAWPQTFVQFLGTSSEDLIYFLRNSFIGTSLVERQTSVAACVDFVRSMETEGITLIEIGCGMGLNLRLSTIDPEFSEIHVNHECRALSEAVPKFERKAPVNRKIGIDVWYPADAGIDDISWYSAMLFPEWEMERERLIKAMNQKPQVQDVEFVKGDIFQVLPGVLADTTGPICVLHSQVAWQWSSEQRTKLDDILLANSEISRVHRVGIEAFALKGEELRAHLALKTLNKIPLTLKSEPCKMCHSLYWQRVKQDTQLGLADGLGGWIDWRLEVSEIT